MKRSLFNKCKKSKVIIALSILSLLSFGSMCYCYLYSTAYITGNDYINITIFAPKVNDSSSVTQDIDIVNTIVNNKSFGPGAEGVFKIDVDLNDNVGKSYYKVSLDRTNLPNNLKFYVDSEYRTEFDCIKGIQLSSNEDKLAEHYIYWRWISVDDVDSNANDSLYINQEIVVPITIYVSQKIEGNTVLVNNIEKQTGRIDIKSTNDGNNKGMFTISLDFSNIAGNKDYRIHFGELSTNLHFYSDPSFQNEISFVEGIFNGTNSVEDINVYWKLENDNISTLNDGLYYAVVLGSW